ncbi:PD40 domain-containing protein, partial [bacterium]|nr:PD40 domain-containing protein [bacterium]
RPGTQKSGLLSEGKNLLNIPDIFGGKFETVETALGFTNLSSSPRELNPDLEFSLLSNEAVVTIRPEEKTNRLMLLQTLASGVQILPPGSQNYSNLRCSPDGEYLTFEQGEEVFVMKVPNGKPEAIFPAKSKILLDLAWAPSGSILAGIVLDRQTNNREIFLFDAKNSRHFNQIEESLSEIGDYQYPFPYWAPDGKKLLFSSGNEINYIDLSQGKVFQGVVRKNFDDKNSETSTISEIVWAPDSQSFAWVEARGQARDKLDFDSNDFKGYSLYRVCLDSVGRLVEDTKQRYVSSQTIRLLGFWTNDRMLFLEGRLKSQKISSNLWDLSEIFHAKIAGPAGNNVTPVKLPILNSSDSLVISSEPIILPLEYCFAFKNLENKFKNVYNAGHGNMNQLFCDQLITTWFVGLKTPTGLQSRWETFNLMPSPYPFPERNITYFLDLSKSVLKPVVELLEAYSLYRFEISGDLKKIFFLSNSRGPLTLWTGALDKICEMNLSNFREMEEEKKSEEDEQPGSFLEQGETETEKTWDTSREKQIPDKTRAGDSPFLQKLPPLGGESGEQEKSLPQENKGFLKTLPPIGQ